ncbi:MAG TPA: FHA domain-containing protein [Polyangium sp.]|nr:FHA domain-containing protein [Polyangium sp.]
MGALFWKNSNKHFPMRTQALLGRHAQCDIRVEAPKVSGQHARLQWVDDAWEVRDLGSRNGTFVDGRRLEPGGRVAVDTGAMITLARHVAEFELVDSSAPGAVAVEVQTGISHFSDGGLLALPNDENPIVTVFMNGEGEWYIESGNASRVAVDGEILDADDTKYLLELPNIETETYQSGTGSPTLDSIALRLGVTPDEEQVEVTVIVGGHAKRLPVRRYHYLLVTLARAWLAEENVGESMRGWVDRDTLCRGLEMDPMKLSVEIYRARKQLAALGIQGAAGLIQRRVGTHEIRIGVPNVQVLKL